MYKMKIFVAFPILFVEILYVPVTCAGYTRCTEEGILTRFKVCILSDVVFFQMLHLYKLYKTYSLKSNYYPLQVLHIELVYDTRKSSYLV